MFRKHALTVATFSVLIGLFAFAANDWKAPWHRPPAPDPKDWCKEHKVAASKCEKCKPELARGGTFSIREREPKEGECPNTLVRVTLAPDLIRQMAIALQPVEPKPVTDSIKANGETQYPPTQYSRVAPRISGVIREVKARLGQSVEAGAPLAVIESTEFGEAKSDYLQAAAVLRLREKTYEQEKTLAEKKITAGRELLHAETELEEARISLRRSAQKLSALGVSGDKLKALAQGEDGSPLLELVAPFAGIVVEATAVPGEIAGPEKPVFAVAQTERLWVAVDVYEPDLPKLEEGQRVVFTVDGLVGKKFPGKVVAIGGEVDERTRTVRVYADVKNVDGLLKARMFGRAEIAVKPTEPKLLVPKAAVQSDGDCQLVFVSPAANIFQARKVELGRSYGNAFEVTGGLTAGDKVATTGSFLLKTEVLRGQMGAG
jgi:cobalt-zinc-cadmium efflux system membrane fusion protein